MEFLKTFFLPVIIATMSFILSAVIDVSGDPVMGSSNTVHACSNSVMNVTPHQVDYFWEINFHGLHELLEDLDIQSVNRENVQFLAKVEKLQLFSQEVRILDAWSFNFRKSQNNVEFFTIEMQRKVPTAKDENYTCTADLAVTVGDVTIFAPKNSHIDKTTVDSYHVPSSKNLQNVTTHSSTWRFPIDDFIELFKTSGSGSTSSISSFSSSTASSIPEHEEENPETNKINLVFRIKIRKAGSNKNPTGLSNDCKNELNFEAREKAESMRGGGIRFFSGSIHNSTTTTTTPPTTTSPYFNYSTTFFSQQNPNTLANITHE